MKTITFYSYKGGVGRSLALANIATRLAEFKKKICLLDFDLEAPGLQYKFKGFLHNKVVLGIADYIHAFSSSGILPKSILDYTIKFNIDSAKHSIDIIPAGNVDSKGYWKKLAAIDWNQLLYENENGIAFFLDLKEKIQKELNPDFLLIDSRTGISEMSGITMSLFADEVVIVAANNQENLHGCKKIIRTLSNPQNIIQEKSPIIRFVLSRIPFSDNDPEEKLKEQVLVDQIKREILSPYVTEVNVIHSDRELEESEKIKIGYRNDDGTAQISKDYLNLFETITEGDLSDDEIKIFRNLKEAERIYAKAVEETSWVKKLPLINAALEYNDQNLDYLFYKAVILSRLLEKDSAKTILSEIINRDEEYKPAYIQYANILIDQGHQGQAIVHLNRLLKLDPKNLGGLLYMAYAYSKMKEFEKSNEFYSMAISINPNIATAFYGRANNFRKLKNFDAAYKDIYKAIELNSEAGVSFMILSLLHAEMGRIDDFYLSFDLALKNDRSKNMETFILHEPILERFFKQEKFVKIIEKYNISLPTSFWEKVKK